MFGCFSSLYLSWLLLVCPTFLSNLILLSFLPLIKPFCSPKHDIELVLAVTNSFNLVQEKADQTASVSTSRNFSNKIWGAVLDLNQLILNHKSEKNPYPWVKKAKKTQISDVIANQLFLPAFLPLSALSCHHHLLSWKGWAAFSGSHRETY